MAKTRSGISKRKLPIISITLSSELLQQIDARAGKHDMNRSQFFRDLARKDLAAKQTEAGA